MLKGKYLAMFQRHPIETCSPLCVTCVHNGFFFYFCSFNRLDLPPYTSYEILTERLTTAIESCEGFEGVDQTNRYSVFFHSSPLVQCVAHSLFMSVTKKQAIPLISEYNFLMRISIVEMILNFCNQTFLKILHCLFLKSIYRCAFFNLVCKTY